MSISAAICLALSPTVVHIGTRQPFVLVVTSDFYHDIRFFNRITETLRLLLRDSKYLPTAAYLTGQYIAGITF